MLIGGLLFGCELMLWLRLRGVFIVGTHSDALFGTPLLPTLADRRSSSYAALWPSGHAI